MAVLSLGAVVAWSDDAPTKKPRDAAAPKKPIRSEKVAAPLSPEREETVVAFVREHHPELASLLEQLKPMRPTEYNRAVAEIWQVSRSLENLKTSNPRRYELGLDLWKAKSNAELLAAKLVSGPTAELESQLRAALAHQLDLEVRQQELEREVVQARLKQVEASLKRLNENRDKLIDSRLQGLRNKVQRARRLEPGKSAPAKVRARTKVESKA
jgi:hypothetical protein